MIKNIVFFGSSPYSLIILKKLQTLSSFSISAIITKADKAFGRNQTITANPVADFVKKYNLTSERLPRNGWAIRFFQNVSPAAAGRYVPLLQPLNFDQKFIHKLADLKPDLVLVVAYGPPFFSQEMIDIPPFKIINIHPSALPLYRGATPGPWQIINGETKSAVSFFQIDALPDHGPIITQIPFDISPTETSPSFYQKAFVLAADNLDVVLNAYISHPDKLTVQDHSKKTYFPKFNQEKAQIDWSWPADKIGRFIRALLPWPIAWTYVQNQAGLKLKMKIFSATIVSASSLRGVYDEAISPKDRHGLRPRDDVFVFIPQSVQIEGKTKADWLQISPYYQIVKTPISRNQSKQL